ncbi:HET domain-containing protein [Fusarium sp. LHS14.1]|nr:HET domain-containing protein [Fusarium sp. LHS14.1]
MSVFYNITDVDVFNGVAGIEDCYGEKGGRVGLDALEDLEHFDFTRSFQFILLSECWAPKSIIEETLAEEQDEDDNNAPKEDLKYYNALLKEWQGGIAERRGFAVILQDAVENSLPPGPVWKDILLA